MWTSGGAILRDLSRAQGGAGRGAHADMRALRPRDRPPPPPRWLSEEMEEYVLGLAPAPTAAAAAAAAACEGGPDLRHIQQMLDMVRKLNIAEEEMANDEAFMSKLDSYTIEHSRSTAVRRAKPDGHADAAAPATGHQLPEPQKHKKRRRNIALESILQTLENNERNDAINCSSEPLPLLTPQELTRTFANNMNGTGGTDHKNAEDSENTSSYNKIDSNVKVNHWMNQMMSPIQRKSQSKCVVREAIRLDPSSMFKKKVKLDVAKPHPKVNCEAFKNDKWPASGAASYVPSAGAALCYQRYLENNKQLQMRRDEASQLAVLITEALERAVQVGASGQAVLEEAPEPAALEEALERAAPEEVPKPSVLEEATEWPALGETSEWPALGVTSEWPALGETSEWPALGKTSEWPALGEEATACVGSCVARALRRAPAGARLAAPRACAPRARCAVCACLAPHSACSATPAHDMTPSSVPLPLGMRVGDRTSVVE